ncbi:hypothetical protein ACFLSJ_07470 [Verrucomicrobiota bacterium]
MNSRTKGKGGEVEAAHYLTELFKLPVRRGQQYRGGPDSPDVAGLPGLHIEVKRVEKLNLDTALEQAAREAGTNEVPLVLHRRNRKRWKFTFYADDLLRFLDATGALIDEGHQTKLNDGSPRDCVGPSGPTTPGPSSDGHRETGKGR